MLYSIYTDGGCSGNKKNSGCPGGFGFIILNNRNEILISDGGRVGNTTNNRMELTAVINSLKRLMLHLDECNENPKETAVIVMTDSQYVSNNFEEYLLEWKKRGWRKGNGQPVLNDDLWKQLDALTPEFLQFSFRWVRGHNGDEYNELVDGIVRKHIYG
jgi:ribonuclease HI